MGFSYNYPTIAEVEAYWNKAISEIPAHVEPIEERERSNQPGDAPDRHTQSRWLRFEGTDGVKFWCLWQPCSRPGRRKTLIHLPGYGTEVSAHPGFIHAGYNVMHINPRGYCGPDGHDNLDWRSSEGEAMVLYRNLDKPEEYGYRYWFQDAVTAVRWLQKQPNVDEKLGFFGSSQGGGGALILASILASEGIVGAVAADVPFLTNFPSGLDRKISSAYEAIVTKLSDNEDKLRQALHTFGHVDTIVHAPRMKYPVLLNIGSNDETCTPGSIYSLYKLLPDTRAVVELHGQGHAYTPPFPSLAEMWFNLYL